MRCTLCDPKSRHGVRFGASAHRGSRNPVTVCDSGFLHTARPETPSRCAIRPFCTPRFPKPRHGVRFAHFAHRTTRNPVTVCDSPILHTARPRPTAVILNLIQDLFFANPDFWSSPDDEGIMNTTSYTSPCATQSHYPERTSPSSCDQCVESSPHAFAARTNLMYMALQRGMLYEPLHVILGVCMPTLITATLGPHYLALQKHDAPHSISCQEAAVPLRWLASWCLWRIRPPKTWPRNDVVFIHN
jgi:hypothetical protein